MLETFQPKSGAFAKVTLAVVSVFEFSLRVGTEVVSCLLYNVEKVIRIRGMKESSMRTSVYCRAAEG